VTPPRSPRWRQWWPGLDESITRHKIRPGTARRIIPYALHYRRHLVILLAATAVDATIAAAGPLLLSLLIDDGIEPRRLSIVTGLAIAIAVLALVDAVAVYAQTWYSGRIGQGLIYDLRTSVFDHVQRQSIAFFTRTQTGSLVSRLNTDVVGAQQAVTTLLSTTVATILTLVLVLGTMFYLSWQITLAALGATMIFLLPVRRLTRSLQRLTREGMQLDAELGSMMNERFNVSGAMLAKLYGRPEDESAAFASRADRVRGIRVMTNVRGRVIVIFVTLLTALTTALVYGLGGVLVMDGTLRIGSLVAMVTLLVRLYGPINQLSNMQVLVMTALVSFDRIFEVLDLRPHIEQRPQARALAVPGPAGTAPGIEFDQVEFRYPTAAEVSLTSLESIASRPVEHQDARPVLRGVSFCALPGRITALVGPSGAGKSTITHLVSRLYDPTAGAVRIAGTDIRDLTLRSLREVVGVVTQDPHLFHDTIRANLTYARTGATEEDLIEACEAAQIRATISRLPDGFDTVVGDRGYRLSGGEKQRVALARLLIKSPAIVVLDEATAHLDSESEAALQLALKNALHGRTSLVIAHRLSTIRDADQILVVDEGRIRESGTHDELLVADGLYTDLYRTQFAESG
jgi:ATP-binding cassette subfamily B protein